MCGQYQILLGRTHPPVPEAVPVVQMEKPSAGTSAPKNSQSDFPDLFHAVNQQTIGGDSVNHRLIVLLEYAHAVIVVVKLVAEDGLRNKPNQLGVRPIVRRDSTGAAGDTGLSEGQQGVMEAVVSLLGVAQRDYYFRLWESGSQRFPEGATGPRHGRGVVGEKLFPVVRFPSPSRTPLVRFLRIARQLSYVYGRPNPKFLDRGF